MKSFSRLVLPAATAARRFAAQCSMKTDLRSPENVSTGAEENIPGDSMGTLEHRSLFTVPTPRRPFHDASTATAFAAKQLAEEEIAHPQLQYIASRLGVPLLDVAAAMWQSKCNVNEAIHCLEETNPQLKARGGAPPRSYGVVAMEAYDPETYCLIHFTVPNYEALQNDDVLEGIHELTLSGAEIPIDTPRKKMLDRFVSEWTVESGESVATVLKNYDLGVTEILHLPYGEYAVQGHYVNHPIKPHTPNIGTGASCVCLDLRSGIHTRFRFHAERIADNLAEHVVQDALHYQQEVHMLRQTYWFNPEYSVEDYIRFKESLMQPSFLVFEMRYMHMSHFSPIAASRNIIELEELKVEQHKFVAHIKRHPHPGSITGRSGQSSLAACAAGEGPFSRDQQPQVHTSDLSKRYDSNMDKETDLGTGMRIHEMNFGKQDLVWRRFYTNHYY